MKTNLNFINIRCSIFVPKVAYNNDNLTKMMSAFPNFLPSTVQIPPIPLLGLPIIQQDFANQPWQLTSADKQKCITSFDDKIDSNLIDTVHLDLLYRQDENSYINTSKY